MRAKDRELGRSVAIKELLVATRTSELRFFREALVTARLEHPGIVPVHEAGRWPDGTPFYAMKLVAGRPLSDLIAESSTQEARLSLITHVVAVADAVAYAHSRGVIHRDLKPANVIVGAFGETVVIDWGLAGELGGSCASRDVATSQDEADVVSSHLTAVGTVMGTPAYMAPEQSRGERTDERCDVYSVGAMLAHLVTGAVPAPGRRVSGPRDLLAIIAKARAVAADDRYSSMKALAEDLRRFQGGAMVQARRYSHLERAGHTLARHRRAVLYAALATTIIALILFITNRRVTNQRDELLVARRDLQDTAGSLRTERDRQVLARARLEATQDPSQAMGTLSSYAGNELADVAEIALQASERGIADLIVSAEPFNLLNSTTTQGGILYSTGGRRISQYPIGASTTSLIADGLSEYGLFVASIDGNRVAYVDSRHRVRVASNGSVYDIATVPSVSASLSMSEDGRWLTILTLDGVLRICELMLPASTCRTVSHVEMAMVSRSGNAVALCKDDVTGALVPTVGGLPLATWPCPMSFYSSISRAKGDEFVVALDRDLVIVSVARAPLVIRTDFKTNARFVSASGASVAAADSSGVVKVWSQESGHIEYALSSDGDSERSSITAIALDASRRQIAIGSENGRIRLRSLTSRLDQPLVGHKRAPHKLSFLSDGRLLSLSIDSSRVWNSQAPTATSLATESDAFFHAAYLHDDVVAAETRRGRVYLFDVKGGRQKVVDLGMSGGFGLAVSERQEIAVAGRDGTIPILGANGAVLRRLTGHVGILRHVVWQKSGALLSCGADGTIRRWTVTDGSHVVMAQHPDECYRVAVSPDGERFASAMYDGNVILGQVTGQPIVKTVRVSDARVNSLSFLGKDTIVVACDVGLALIADVDSHPQFLLQRTASAMIVGTHPTLGIISAFDDGAVFASRPMLSRDPSASLDDARYVTQVLVPATGAVPRAIESSPDQRYIAVAYASGAIRIIRTQDLAVGAVIGHTDIVSGLSFSYDSSRLVSSGQDGRVLSSSVETLRFIAAARLNIVHTRYIKLQANSTHRKAPDREAYHQAKAPLEP